MLGNKTGDKITKCSKNWSQNNSETVTHEEKNIELDREIPRERYISQEKLLMTANYWWSKTNIMK